MDQLERDDKIGIVMLGRPYHHDPGLNHEIMEEFQKLGYPVQPLFPTDGPSVMTGTWGMISLLNKAPHPSAAQLFINWFAGPSAQLAFSKATQALSLRTDLKYDGFPSYLFPQKGTKYVDTYDYKFVTETRDPALEKVRQLLGE